MWMEGENGFQQHDEGRNGRIGFSVRAKYVSKVGGEINCVQIEGPGESWCMDFVKEADRKAVRDTKE